MLAPATAAVTPGELWGAWNLDVGLLVGLAGVTVLYASAVRGLWRSVGRDVGISRGQVGMFAGGMTAVLLALVSPLDALSEALFGAHMVQHLLLTIVAAPLLVGSRLPLALVLALPLRLRRPLGRRLARALRRAGPAAMAAAVVLHVGVVFLWHLPGVYELAVASQPVHVLEHATLLAAAMPFWAAMGAGRPAPVAAAGLAAFVSALSFTLLAAAMSVASAPWYASHLGSTAPWGLTPLQDQQLAGAIMWVPGGLVYLAAAAGAIVRWIRADERSHAIRA